MNIEDKSDCLSIAKTKSYVSSDSWSSNQGALQITCVFGHLVDVVLRTLWGVKKEKSVILAIFQEIVGNWPGYEISDVLELLGPPNNKQIFDYEPDILDLF
jgi:hypothetical protein